MADLEAPSCDAGCAICCKQEFQKSNFLLSYHDDRHFVHFQWGGNCLTYWFWRLIWIVYHLVWIILSGVYSTWWAGDDPANQIKWFIYLTNWCFFMLTLSTIVDFICVTYVNWKDKDIKDGLSFNTPWYFKADWVLFNVGNSCSICVSLLYWGLLYKSGTTIDSINLVTHGLNTVYVLINIFVSAFPVRFLHFFHGSIFAIVYIVFSVIYQTAEGTNAAGNNYIYKTLDWDETGMTLGLCIAVAFVAMPVIHIVCWGIYKLRVCIFNSCCERTAVDRGTKFGISNRAMEMS